MRRDKGLVDWVGRTSRCPMAAHERPGCLLLADADPVSREQRGRELAELDYHVWVASSLGEASAIIAAEQPHFAIIDYKLSDGSGVSLIPRLVTADPAARLGQRQPPRSMRSCANYRTDVGSAVRRTARWKLSPDATLRKSCASWPMTSAPQRVCWASTPVRYENCSCVPSRRYFKT